MFFRFLFIFLFFADLNASLSLQLSERQSCDLEMLMVGGFAPLRSFMSEQDYRSVVTEMHLSTGEVWPIPIVLDVSTELGNQIHVGDSIKLVDEMRTPLAELEVTDRWIPDKRWEAEHVYKTTDPSHPGVDYLYNQTGEIYLGGKLTFLKSPSHYAFEDLRKTPSELKNHFKEKGIEKVVAFQTRNPMHRAHVELTTRAAEQTGAHLLIHPVVGLTQPGDIDPYTRVRCYRHLLKRYPEDSVTLSVLPLAMRMAGPREALWHAIIRKNYGATHFIIGRDHAGPSQGVYDPYAAQILVQEHSADIGIEVVPFREIVYSEEEGRYVQKESGGQFLSGTELRRRLESQEEIPEWFSYPEVIEELKKSKRGLTLFLTGLSGAGKSTLARALHEKFREVNSRAITLLDGDVIRKNLSSRLGFSRRDRSENVRRVGYVAAEVCRHGGIAICSLIAPYEDDRAHNRERISPFGNYVEIYLSTPLSECERRDPKGLYAKVRRGEITNFTGINDPYEPPKHPEIVIDTTNTSVQECLEIITKYIKEKKI